MFLAVSSKNTQRSAVRPKRVRASSVDVGVRLMHLLHAEDHGALQQLFKARVLLEGQVEGLMRPVGQTPYAVAVGLQIRQQLDHAGSVRGKRVRVVADVELEDVGEFLALFAYHIRVDVREILAGVHAVLVAEEAAGSSSAQMRSTISSGNRPSRHARVFQSSRTRRSRKYVV